MASASRQIAIEEEWLDRLNVGVVLLHGRSIIRCNRTAMAFLGYADVGVIGKNIGALLRPREANEWDRWLGALSGPTPVLAPLRVSLPESAAGAATSLRLTGGIVDGWPASTRLITLQEATNESEAPRVNAELRRMLRQLLDGNPVPTFVLNSDHLVVHWNKACEAILGVSASEVIGTRRHWSPFYEHERPVLADLVIDGTQPNEVEKLYGSTLRASTLIAGGFEAEGYFPNIGVGGRWLLFTAAPIRNSFGGVIGAIETLVDITDLRRAELAIRQSRAELEQQVARRTLQLETIRTELEADITQRERAESELLARYRELTSLNMTLADINSKLQDTQQQLVQSEKLASIGQLAAGVAHEINNPIGYVHSNLGSLEHYLTDLFTLFDAYSAAECGDVDALEIAKSLRVKLDLDFLREDIPSLLSECREGISRVKKIVQDLKDFSRVDSSHEWQVADIHQGLDSTLNIAFNEIKYRADVEKQYGDIPKVECLPSQINQVTMNLMVNAAHAIGEHRGRIILRTGSQVHQGVPAVWIEVEDNGRGMTKEVQDRIFDPFFTTKPIGQGTGLGLSLAYGIVKKHGGLISVESEIGRGTTFRVVIPVKHQEPPPVQIGG